MEGIIRLGLTWQLLFGYTAFTMSDTVHPTFSTMPYNNLATELPDLDLSL